MVKHVKKATIQQLASRPVPGRDTPPPLMGEDEEPPKIFLFGTPMEPLRPDRNYQYDIKSHAESLGRIDPTIRPRFDINSEESPVDYSTWAAKRKADKEAELEELERKKRTLQQIPPFKGDPAEEKRIREMGYVEPMSVSYFGIPDPNKRKWEEQVRKDKIREETERMKRIAAESRKRRHSPEANGRSVEAAKTRRESSAPPEMPEKRFIPPTCHIKPEYVYDRDTTPYSHGIYLDTKDPLNLPLRKNERMDTAAVAARMVFEFAHHGISQAEFARNVIDRREDTLSGLLKKPAPWGEMMKSEKETFLRMRRWLELDVQEKLSTAKGIRTAPVAPAALAAPVGPTTAVLKPTTAKVATAKSAPTKPAPAKPAPAKPAPAKSAPAKPAPAKPAAARQAAPRPPVRNVPVFRQPLPPAASEKRLVFTEEQKKVLSASFKENDRPANDVLESLAEELKLPFSSVSNFFMNRRRRGLN